MLRMLIALDDGNKNETPLEKWQLISFIVDVVFSASLFAAISNDPWKILLHFIVATSDNKAVKMENYNFPGKNYYWKKSH